MAVQRFSVVRVDDPSKDPTRAQRQINENFRRLQDDINRAIQAGAIITDGSIVASMIGFGFAGPDLDGTPGTAETVIGLRGHLLPDPGAPEDGQAIVWNDGGQVWAYDDVGGSPLTTKGDLFTYDSADARLPIGTDDWVLVPDAAETTGLKWIGVSTLLDSLFSDAQGAILYRGAAGWAALAPGSSGYFLKTQGAAADPVWAAAAGGYTDPLTTNGDIVIRAAGSTTRLGIGTAGQVLAVNSGLPSWQTNSPTLPLTTKGDLLVYDTGLNRLPVGTDGQVLTADAASTPGVKWAAAAGGSTLPWWQQEKWCTKILNARFHDGAWDYDDQSLALYALGTDTIVAGTLLKHGNLVYDAAPVANQNVGYECSPGWGTPLSPAGLVSGVDMYACCRMGVLGRDDLTHRFCLSGPNTFNDSTVSIPPWTTSSTSYWYVGIDSVHGTDTNWMFSVGYHDGSTPWVQTRLDTGVACSENTAYFLEIEYDATAGEWRAYINGSLVATATDASHNTPTSDGSPTTLNAELSIFVCNQNTTTPTDTQELEVAMMQWCIRDTGVEGYSG